MNLTVEIPCNARVLRPSCLKAAQALVALTCLAASVALGAPVIADYEDIRVLGVHEGTLLFASGEKLGIANARGEVLIPPQYSRLFLVPSKHGNRFAVKGGLPGFLTQHGQFEPIAALEQFSSTSREITYLPEHDAFGVFINGRYGVVRSNGAWLLPPEFDLIHPLKGSTKIFFKKGDGGVIFQDGRIQTTEAFQWPVDQRLMTVIRSKPNSYAYAITDYDGRPVSDYEFSELSSQDGGLYYGVRSSRRWPSQPEAAIYELRKGRLEVAFEARLPWGGLLWQFSEGLIFVCAPIGPPKSEGEYAAALLSVLSGTCGYVDRYGKPIATPHPYRTGSRFVNGKAVACRVDRKARKHFCAWLRRDGSVIVEREFDGELHDGKADDQVAVIREEGNWTLFFPSGERINIPMRSR